MSAGVAGDCDESAPHPRADLAPDIAFHHHFTALETGAETIGEAEIADETNRAIGRAAQVEQLAERDRTAALDIYRAAGDLGCRRRRPAIGQHVREIGGLLERGS